MSKRGDHDEQDWPLPPSAAVRRMAEKRGEKLGREAQDDVILSEVSPARVSHPHGETTTEPDRG